MKPEAGSAIAIVGMAGRFPGARNLEAFWENLRGGVESITYFTDEDLESTGTIPLWQMFPHYVKAKPVLEGVELFDAEFFGVSPREAEVMDPQHRLFLECAWEALEHSGYDPDRFPGLIGVYGGSGLNTYLLYNVLTSWRAFQVGLLQTILLSDKDYLATRVAFRMNLRGPAVTLQTACSTSLVAVHLACQSLLTGECDMALAGGVSVKVPQKAGYLFEPGGIFSPDGHTRAFDVNGQGTVFGSGVGVVALKRLDDAVSAGDTVHAVIRGSAVNNDGASKLGYTAPSEDGQTAVITEALAMAGVEPDAVGLVEAHGTATALGDVFEMRALTRAFQERSRRRGFCALGSVKTNVGHLDAAAGVAGLIKAVLALQRHEIPPSLNFEQPNPRCAFDDSPFYVNTAPVPWPNGSGPRRAGVNSFGIGGTNAHVVLEEAPLARASDASLAPQLLVVSARTPEALAEAGANLAAALEREPDTSLADVAYTLQVGRKAFAWRRAAICANRDEAVVALRGGSGARILTGTHHGRDRSVVWMFPGQGAQYAGMGAELYAEEPTFRAAVDRGAEVLKPELGLDLRGLLFPTTETREAVDARLAETAVTQPAVFLIEYALAQLWLSYGVQPAAMIGHSIGEFVAACLAGVMDVDDALRLIALRGRLMQAAPRGAMLAVALDPEEAERLAGAALSLSAVNGPRSCVLSGPPAIIDELESKLRADDVGCRRLHTSHAFHSTMMEPVVVPFVEAMARVTLRRPELRFVSNVTGKWITAEEAVDPAYWGRHLRQAVRFWDGLRALVADGDEPVFLEVGPGQTLSALARPALGPQAAGRIVSSLPRPETGGAESEGILPALGSLWVAGVPIEWESLHRGRRRRRVPLPTYPFQRRRYWIEGRLAKTAVTPMMELAIKLPLGQWFHVPVWKHSPPPRLLAQAASARKGGLCLVFLDESGVGDALAARLRARGSPVVTVAPGPAFDGIVDDRCELNVEQAEDYERLIGVLRDADRVPETIVHLWGVPPDAEPRPEARCASALRRGFYSLLFLAQALGRRFLSEAVRLFVVTSGCKSVAGDEVAYPERATALGPARVIPQEHRNVECRLVDVEPPADAHARDALATELEAELAVTNSARTIAYRRMHRWVEEYEPFRLDTAPERVACLRPEGVYLITGGLGGIGLVVAEWLAREVGARLVLTGRSSFPGRAEWEGWLASHDEKDATARRIRRLMDLETLGGRVLVVQADAADEVAMRAAVAAARNAFGALHGVFHAAGILGAEGFSDIQSATVAHCEAQFRPKVDGLFVLERIVDEAPLDFVVLFSSLAAILGGLGFVGYAAANAFMDAWADSRNARGRVPWISINFDAGLGDTPGGPAAGVSEGINMGEAGLEALQRLASLGIKPPEGVEALRRLLSIDGLTRVAVSATALPARLALWVERKATDGQEPQALPQHARPSLPNDYVPPRTETEKVLAEMWREPLGIERIGVHDDFFALGGHSLMATSLIGRIRARFKVPLALREFFGAPTIERLAAVLEEAVAARVAGGEGARASDTEEREAILPVPRAARRMRRVRVAKGTDLLRAFDAPLPSSAGADS